MTPAKKRYQNIQILRIAACFGTFLVHFGQRIELGGMLRKATDFGAYGVYMFFLISGFVAFFSVDKGQNDFSVKHYFKGRAVRILPIYYLIIFYNFILHTFVLSDVPVDTFGGGRYQGPGWFRYILFLNILIPYDNDFWGNLGATWTIQIFVLFYILVPLGRKFINNTKTAIISWLIIYVLGILNIPLISTQALDNLHFLFLGVVLYFCVKESKETIFALAAIIYLGLEGVVCAEWRMAVVIILFSLLILCSMGIHIKNKTVRKVIDKLDEYSYAVYLVHAVFIEWVDRYKAYTIDTDWRIGAIAIAIIGTTAGCILVHEFFEKPIQKLLKNKSKN
ncbi:MAG: acyltransferase [Lachnospiraceae bacterium]|nr:acyltransferase [Lachnospiraceae bacterium]